MCFLWFSHPGEDVNKYRSVGSLWKHNGQDWTCNGIALLRLAMFKCLILQEWLFIWTLIPSRIHVFRCAVLTAPWYSSISRSVKYGSCLKGFTDISTGPMYVWGVVVMAKTKAGRLKKKMITHRSPITRSSIDIWLNSRTITNQIFTRAIKVNQSKN